MQNISDFCKKLSNPGQSGACTFTEAIYAAPNLDYSSNPDLNQYFLYHNPTEGFATRRIDISTITELGFGVNWTFDSTQVPINGQVRIPVGNGPFPLVIFAHGNHDPLENSTPGYIYLCELLASHGIIAATIDVNFLNGFNFGENDARAIVHLEHVKQFQLWNAQPGHILEGKVDMSRVMIVGHSRGGEAVGHASLFNSMHSVQFEPELPPVPLDGSLGLGPYGFNIRAAVAIAPTDGQYIPVTGPTQVQDNYLIVHGSRDGDVFTFEGYKTYDRSHTVNIANPTQPTGGFKSLLWIHGANHNYFNSVWQQESSNTIEREEQEQIAKVYISALAMAILQDKHEFLELLRNHTLGLEAGWLPQNINLVSQFQDSHRLFVQHFEESESNIVVSKPVEGTVKASEINAKKLSFEGQQPTDHLYQETQGLQLRWTGDNGSYRIKLASDTLDTKSFKFLTLRVGQSSEPNNQIGEDQDFTIEVRDKKNASCFTASSIHRLIYPDKFVLGFSDGGESEDGLFVTRTVMQTLRIPLKNLQADGIDIHNLTEIKLSFNIVPSGTLYLDDLQLSN
jgi:predicted dienelactone hydrolase